MSLWYIILYMNLPDRDDKLRMCPEVRERIQYAQTRIFKTGAIRVTCERCTTAFDITADGAFPVADFCKYGTSQLTPDSKVDE